MDGRPFTVLALDGRLQVDGETTDTHARVRQEALDPSPASRNARRALRRSYVLSRCSAVLADQ
jgi:hypothetical protein